MNLIVIHQLFLHICYGLISNKYKVAISGDGGDELLGGYLRTSLSLGAPNKFKQLYSKFIHFTHHFGNSKSILEKRKYDF